MSAPVVDPEHSATELGASPLPGALIAPDALQWEALCAIACEKRVSLRGLSALFDGRASGHEIRRWLERWLQEGWVLDAGSTVHRGFNHSPESDRALCVRPELRPSILRRAAAEESLEAIAANNQLALGERSVAPFFASLYGAPSALGRALTLLRFHFPVHEAAPFARRSLQEALGAGFDRHWLEQTWGADASKLARQALDDALIALEPVPALLSWVKSSQLEALEPALVRLLCEHFLLGGEFIEVARCAALLPAREQLLWAAGVEVATQHLEPARAHLDEWFGWAQPARSRLSNGSGRSKEVGPCPSVLALLAVASSAPGTDQGWKLATRLLRAASKSEAAIAGWFEAGRQAAVSRAVRQILQRLTRPAEQLERLDVHQLPPEVHAWEVLLLGQLSHAHTSNPVTRKAWSQRLERDAKRWAAAGYAWFATQGEALAHALGDDTLAPAPAFWSLLPDPAPWRGVLQTLSSFASSLDTTQRAPETRVAWFVDMVHGTLASPGIERFSAGVGWTRGPRLTLDELLELQERWPDDDGAVLDRIRPLRGSPALAQEALAALCGHPRVHDGARGRARVDVVHGRCRIELLRDGSDYLLRLQPRTNTAGVCGVPETAARLVVYRVTAAQAQLASLMPNELVIPEAELGRVREMLSSLADHVEVHDSLPRAEATTSADATPCLRISPSAGAWLVELGVRPFGEQGRFFAAGSGPRLVTRYEGGHARDVERDTELEQARCLDLARQCPTLNAALEESAPNSPTFDLEMLFALLTELRQLELAHHIEWQNTRPMAARGIVTRDALRGGLRRVKGWYLVTGRVSTADGRTIPIEELVGMPFTRSGRFVRLPNGDFVELEARVRRTLRLLAATASISVGHGLKVPDTAFALLSELDTWTELASDASVHAELLRVRQTLNAAHAVPTSLKATLRPYQARGYEWLYRCAELGVGACLADDMGLGKTVQVLALLLARQGRGPSLVVAPTSVCANWLSEARQFAPSLRVVDHADGDRSKLIELCQTKAENAPDLVVTSYGLLQQHASELASVEWNNVVLDEAQFIKNAHSVRASCAYRLRAEFRIALSGTPIENHLGELWSIFRFLNPTLLGSHKHFDIQYQKPIERERDTERTSDLRSVVQPFLLRRTKHEVLRDLPSATTIQHEVLLSRDELTRYSWLCNQIRELLHSSKSQRQNKLEILAQLTRLRRFCCHPRLVFPEADLRSTKVESFLELASELKHNGHRALVFSQFVDFLDIVAEQLSEHGFTYRYLHGGTPKAQRAKLVDAFQQGHDDLFLLSLKAGGFGLNLTAADYVVHLDPWWNPATEAQATDRAHRIGQTRPVTVYRLISKGTIEEHVVALHKDKRNLAEALLMGGDAALKFSTDDLLRLLGPALPSAASSKASLD
jgi:hypothetical protein